MAPFGGLGLGQGGGGSGVLPHAPDADAVVREGHRQAAALLVVGDLTMLCMYICMYLCMSTLVGSAGSFPKVAQVFLPLRPLRRILTFPSAAAVTRLPIVAATSRTCQEIYIKKVASRTFYR